MKLNYLKKIKNNECANQKKKMVQFEGKSKYEKKNKKVSRSVRKKIILNLVRENFREFYFSKKKMSLKKKRERRNSKD